MRACSAFERSVLERQQEDVMFGENDEEVLKLVH